jgi:DNA repair ATPase RecN
MTNDELMKKRQEELQHIMDIRAHYEKRIQQVNTLYIELKSLTMQLEQREHIIKEKERLLNIKGKKRTINPISEARKKSLEIIKAATYNLNDPMHLLSQKKRHTNKSNNGCKFIKNRFI